MNVLLVIPTHDRYRCLKRLLISINQAVSCYGEGPLTVRICVVDDGSRDETRSLQTIENGFVERFHSSRGPAAARNRGASSLDAVDYYVFIDDDCVVPRNYFSQLERLLRNSPVPIVGGAVSPLNPQSLIGRYLADIDLLGRPVVGKDGTITCMPTAHLIVQADAFASIGGFDESFTVPGGEDNKFMYEAMSSQIEVSHQTDLYVYHDYDRITIPGLINKFFCYGRGSLAACRKVGKDENRYGGFLTSSALEVAFLSLSKFIEVVILNRGRIQPREQSVDSRLSFRLLDYIRILAYEIGGAFERKQRLYNENE